METVFNLDQIENIAKNIINKVKKDNNNKATILAFSGDLGAGKTTVTKEIAKQLGVKVSIISPTFVIMKKYKTKDNFFKNLIHIDAYRLSEDKNISFLNLKDIIEDRENLVIIEWAEILSEFLPKDVYSIKLEHQSDTTRSIKF